ncbi:MAG: hypothetical protein Q8N27_04215, partial [Candidatus Hydromicrobium sp.]|nr:hypothetical protein [Candidatus Hydromicrobium sp.]
MGVADDTRKLGGDIVASYDLRVKEIRKLAKDTQNTLKGFQGEQKDMAAELRRTLEQGEAERNKAVADLLEKFAKDHEDMAAELRRTLEQGEADRLKAEADRIKAFGSMKNEIQAEQKNRNKAVADLLEKFAKDHEDMAAELRRTLEQG